MTHDPLDQTIRHTLKEVARRTQVRDRWSEFENVRATPTSDRRQSEWTPLWAAAASFGAVVALGGALLMVRSAMSESVQPTIPPVATVATTTTVPPATTSSTTTIVTTTTVVPVVEPSSPPPWPTAAPARYLSASADRIDLWVEGALSTTLMEPGIDKAFVAGDTILFDTVSTSDIYAFPPQSSASVLSPGGAGSLLFGHFNETQIRLHGVVTVDGRLRAVVEEIDEFNFGDERDVRDFVVPRRLMLYDLESGDRELLVDLGDRRPGLSIEVANGSVVQVSEGGGVVAVSFRSQGQSWVEFFALDGTPYEWLLPYRQPSSTTSLLVAALAPDGSTIAVGIGNRVELWDESGSRLDEWSVARDGQVVAHIDFDGARVAGVVAAGVDDPDLESFTLDAVTGALISDIEVRRIAFDRTRPSQ